jgi:hypothetical protein
MKPILQQKIIMVQAEDWSIEDGPIDISHDFTLYKAWVVGFLLKETATSITLAPELFDDRTRRCQTIPKSAIRKRIELKY